MVEEFEVFELGLTAMFLQYSQPESPCCFLATSPRWLRRRSPPSHVLSCVRRQPPLLRSLASPRCCGVCAAIGNFPR